MSIENKVRNVLRKYRHIVNSAEIKKVKDEKEMYEVKLFLIRRYDNEYQNTYDEIINYIDDGIGYESKTEFAWHVSYSV